MGVAVQWDNPEQTVIRWDFGEDWTWDELADSARVSSAMIAGTDAKVDVILNAVSTRAPVGKITAYYRSAFNYAPANVRMLVLVCGQELEAVQLVAPFFEDLCVVDSLEEARETIRTQQV